MTVTSISKGLEEAWGWRDTTHISSNRLDNDGCDFVSFLPEDLLDLLKVIEFEGESMTCKTFGNAERIWLTQGQCP